MRRFTSNRHSIAPAAQTSAPAGGYGDLLATASGGSGGYLASGGSRGYRQSIGAASHKQLLKQRSPMREGKLQARDLENLQDQSLPLKVTVTLIPKSFDLR